MRGAEAVVSFSRLLGKKIVIKNRIAKTYRVSELDKNLRKIRTRVEGRLLHKAKIAGVLCPTVLCVDDFSLRLSFIDGKRPNITSQIAKKTGELLAKLHAADIIHGDFTPANLIFNKNLYVIDFGLGFFSNDIEDKAIDVLTMLKSIEEKLHLLFLKGYSSYKDYAKILKRIEIVKNRVRYF